ncbi:coiled-coil domain-containing protein 170 [Pholidichthys leucotaenia]
MNDHMYCPDMILYCHTYKCNEKERLKMRIAVLEESVKSAEVESSSSREMVLRLVSELDQERRKGASSAAALDSLKVELDGLVGGRRIVEMEKQTLNERLEASRRVIEAARRQSHCLEKQAEELERRTQAAEGKLLAFLEKVASFLQGKSDNIIAPTEGEILQELDKLCNKTVSEMEARLCRVCEKLSEQADRHNITQQKAELMEQEVHDLRERLHGLETKLLTAESHCDLLQQSRQHYEEYLEELSRTLKVDVIDAELGYDMRLKLILSRAEQLVNQEGAALAESKSLTYSLQRKLKSQKDQLESKGLHIQLLRKKASELEEEKRRHSSLAYVERDDARLEARRMQKKLERLQVELKATKLGNTELKTQLSHTSELKLKVMEQSQTMQEQKRKLDDLTDGKSKAEKKLSTVHSELQSQEKRSQNEQQELRALRDSLAQLSDSHRELVDFRLAVSQMLGLDTTALALPNYEVIKLLETLLHSRHHHHHHVNMPWHCSTHQSLHLLQTQDLPDVSTLDVSTCGSVSAADAVHLHKT